MAFTRDSGWFGAVYILACMIIASLGWLENIMLIIILIIAELKILLIVVKSDVPCASDGQIETTEWIL